ncbi:MAG: hypothetical protein NTX79_08510 [Candidatus Micrarchaeota archaeon]|nr:hypothetical protein [Candidatus Micrarchaeota archaeon]
MAKPFALFIGMLLFISMPFAETYSKKYVSDGWLEVTRTIESGKAGQCPLSQIGISDVCANSGTSQAGGSGSVFTLVTLSLRNIGSIDRNYVNIGESLSFVPAGAAVSFSPSPSQFDGRQAVWEVAALSRGETRNVTYEFGASVSEAAVGRIPDAAAIAAPSTAVLSAPSQVQANSTLTVSLKSLDGTPITGAKIVVGYPDGSSQAVRTGSTGAASLMATRVGSYTYSAEGYRLYQMVSTIAYGKNATQGSVPATAASASDPGILPMVLGVLPIFAGIFAAAVVALIIYNFLSARREEEDVSGPAPKLAEEQAKGEPGMNYSQKFTFGTEDEHQKNLDDTTRRMVDSRKRRIQESGPKPPEEHEEADAEIEEAARNEEKVFSAQEMDGSESTVTNGDMDSELVELERNARIAGEVAEQEKEVESMLTQLEDIRNKLRAGRSAKPDGEAGGRGGEAEEPARKPKPPARAAAPASKAATPAKAAASASKAATPAKAAASASKAAAKPSAKQKFRKK